MGLERLELGKRRDFEGDVGVEIGLRCLDRLMAEPQSDHRDIDAGLEQLHCGGMSEDNSPNFAIDSADLASLTVWVVCLERLETLRTEAGL
jgi:hypothetical protein